MTTIESFTRLSDDHLVAKTDQIAAAARVSTADLVAALAEVDRRRLYLELGYSSLFVYCTSRLKLTEAEAFNRIEAARAMRRFPGLLPLLADGALSITGLRLLAPHLTSDNYNSVVEAHAFQGTRAIEKLVAGLRPSPPVPSVVRKLPQRSSSDVAVRGPFDLLAAGHPATDLELSVSTTPSTPAGHRPVVKPLSESHYKVQVTFSADAHDKLRRAQALLRHQIPNGDPAAVLERGLDALIERLMKQKTALTHRSRVQPESRRDSRHIPSSVRREVWTRDNARCAFEGRDGRCGETDFLEYHHVVPYARGGKATADNIELRCRAHNAFEAEREFGLFVREDRPGFEVRPIAPATPARPPKHPAA